MNVLWGVTWCSYETVPVQLVIIPEQLVSDPEQLATDPQQLVNAMKQLSIKSSKTLTSFP